MNITALSDFDSADPESLQEFFDLNDIAHSSVHDAMLETGVLRDRYPLYTEEPDANWLFVHDRDHRARAAALNLPTPPDLSQVDFSDPAQVAAWKQYHYDHHILLNESLGL